MASRIKASKSTVRIEELAESLIRKFGGVEEFAKKYVSDYEAAKMGSVTRARLLDGVSKLLQMVGKKESAVPMDELSDDELQDQIAQHLELVLKTTPVVELVDDKPAEAANNGTPPHK